MLLTLYWFKEKLVHRTQSLPNHSHDALFSTNQIKANVELASTRGTDCMFSLRGLIGSFRFLGGQTREAFVAEEISETLLLIENNCGVPNKPCVSIKINRNAIVP